MSRSLSRPPSCSLSRFHSRFLAHIHTRSFTYTLHSHTHPTTHSFKKILNSFPPLIFFFFFSYTQHIPPRHPPSLLPLSTHEPSYNRSTFISLPIYFGIAHGHVLVNPPYSSFHMCDIQMCDGTHLYV